MRELTLEEQEKQMDFYNGLDKLYLSPSAIKLLVESPKQYQERYIYGNIETKKAKYFDEGSLLHCMVLQPEELGNQFINMGVPTPSDSTKTCIDYLLGLERTAEELEEYSEEIIDYLKEINLHQSLVDDKKAPFLTGDEKRLAKIITENTKEYFRLMVQARDKVIVDNVSWDKCLVKAEAIKTNPIASKLLCLDREAEHSRTEIELRVTGLDFGLKYNVKGILDHINIDTQTKTIYVNDLKTTGGLLEDFKKSYETYGYFLQAYIYSLLGKSVVKNPDDYTVVINFIVVDRNNDVYCFEVTENTLKEAEARTIHLINTEIHYHISNKDFTLPYKFANNLVFL